MQKIDGCEKHQKHEMLLPIVEKRNVKDKTEICIEKTLKSFWRNFMILVLYRKLCTDALLESMNN